MVTKRIASLLEFHLGTERQGEILKGSQFFLLPYGMKVEQHVEINPSKIQLIENQKSSRKMWDHFHVDARVVF